MLRDFASKTGNTWKLLTCFPCLKGNAQIKASLGLQALTALPADRMYQGTAPKHSSCVQSKLAENQAALCGSSGHCQTPGQELQKCSAPAPSQLGGEFWPGLALCVTTGTQDWVSSQLPTLMLLCDGLITAIAHHC